MTENNGTTNLNDLPNSNENILLNISEPTSNVVEGIKIGTNSFVGIGCSVSKNIEPNTRVIPQHRVFYLDNEEA